MLSLSDSEALIEVEGSTRLPCARPNPTVVHLRASQAIGGAEQQILGLSRHLRRNLRQEFILFGERGAYRAFADRLRTEGFSPYVLRFDAPYVRATCRELSELLLGLKASVVCCHGYKADVMGWLAARPLRVPVVGVVHGWTGQSLKVRLYERLDRWCLSRMNRIVCVYEAQASRLRQAGYDSKGVMSIPNGVDPAMCPDRDPEARRQLEKWLPANCTRIIGAVGRLSPEKGFPVLLQAAALVRQRDPNIGFIIFGDGPLRQPLASQIAAEGLSGNVALAGFHADVHRYMAALDLLVIPSDTEGLPCVLLESLASGVPVLATAVGGIPEVIEEGVSGYLVPPREPEALAERILEAVADEVHRRNMGAHGRKRVLRDFTFATTAPQYESLFRTLSAHNDPHDGSSS